MLLVLTSGMQFISANFFTPLLYLDVVLLAVVYIGWHSSPARGATWGTVFGLTQDVVLLLPFLGLNGLTKTLVGFGASFLSRWIFLRGIGPRIFSTSLITILDGALLWGLLWLLGGSPPVQSWDLFLIRVLATGVLGSFLLRFYEHLRFPNKDFTHG